MCWVCEQEGSGCQACMVLLGQGQSIDCATCVKKQEGPVSSLLKDCLLALLNCFRGRLRLQIIMMRGTTHPTLSQ